MILPGREEMMTTLWVDNRVGSKELLPLLRKEGLRAELATLDCGDFAFTGNGPEGPVEVGVERKTYGDLVSSLRTGRLQGRSADDLSQIDRMRKTYDIMWLLVEGRVWTDAQGHLCVGRPRYARRLSGGYSEDSLSKALLSLDLKGGFRIKQAETQQQSAHWLTSLVRWWEKKWDQHQTLNASYHPEGLVKLTRFREMLKPFPGVGLAVSKALEIASGGSFGSLARMTVPELAEMPIQTSRGPVRLGTVKALPLLAAIRKHA